jgi:ABC-type antimicrobial peptide transport system permease subunit
MIGAALAARLGGARCGDRLDLGRDAWTVVGVFAAAASSYEDEAWLDLDDLANDAARIGTTSIVRIRATSEEARDALAGDIAARSEPALDALPEPAFYRRRAEAARTLRGLVVLLAVLAGTAAAAGLANLFHASVDRRRREIGVLRAIGFGRSWVVGTVEIEALAVSCVGFAIGTIAALGAGAFLDARSAARPIESALTPSLGASVLAERSRSDGDASLPALEVGASALAPGAVLALAIGLVAAVGPAWRATRVRPAEVLRAG